MTISFVPGQVNRSENSLVQTLWQKHHVIVYGSGNNLIIASQRIERGLGHHTSDKIIQTIYLENEPSCVAISTKGIISIGVSHKIILYRANEYDSTPHWTHAVEIDVDSGANCMEWAVTEDELVVGSNNSLALYRLYDDYGTLHLQHQWKMSQANAIKQVKISRKAETIVAACAYERLLKVWTRISYGDNTLFELSYLEHPRQTYLKDFYLRKQTQTSKPAEIDGSMANIKNIRSYISEEDSNQVVYTLGSDGILRVWASFEYNGHSHIRSWASYNLQKAFAGPLATFCVVESHYLGRGDSDVIIAVSLSGEVAVHLVSNISANPPNNVRIDPVGDIKTFGPHAFPGEINVPDFDINSPDCVCLKPISICTISFFKNNSLSMLVHDRIKSTIRCNIFTVDSLFDSLPFATLVDKFQGHPKSIRKLVKSPTNDVLLSISNFAEHNYIWEPLVLEEKGRQKMTITKKFQINVGNEESGIWDAVVLSHRENGLGKYLVITLEKGGFIGLYDCDHEDQPATLVKRLALNNTSTPLVFLLTKLDNNYYLVAVFKETTFAWKLVLESLDLFPVEIDPLGNIHQISLIDSSITKRDKNIVTVIDEDGTLEVYSLVLGQKLAWKSAYTIHTSISKATKIQGSDSLNKVAVVDQTGLDLTIWDIKSGVLEYHETYPESNGVVRDLDWASLTSQNSAHSIFSVGFSRLVLLYTQLRYDYTNTIPTFAVLKKIDVSDYTSHEIGDSIWLDGGHLVIGSGNQFFIDDNWVKLGSSSSMDSTIRQLMTGYTSSGVHHVDDGAGYQRINKSTNDLVYSISHLVSILNGPLPVYHPQFLIQCLFMNQVQIVQDVLVSLFQNIRKGIHISWDMGMDMSREVLYTKNKNNTKDKQYSLDVFGEFSTQLAEMLEDHLKKITLPLLTRHQQITLLSIVTITKELKKHLLSLDTNGMRFFVGFKLFQMSTKQPKLSMRDINWALHSDNKEMLLSTIQDHYGHRMKWDNIKQTGIVYWIETPRLVKIIEAGARNEFSDSRDPSGRVSLFYLAMQKKQILIGLWRTVSHPDKQKMLKFLGNDFNEQRWKTAANKNAYVLLGKHRYLDSAAFFLLGGSIKECCNILASKVNDPSLAMAVSKVYSEVSGASNESLITTVENYILPEAISNGDRWTVSWIFWQLGLKECSIQALIRTPLDMVQANKDKFSEQCNRNFISKSTPSTSGQSFLRDDPVLIILFDELRHRKINYLEGSFNISPIEETDFIHKVCMIYTRMGCDYLTILLLRNWTFIHSGSTTKKIQWNEPKTEFHREETEKFSHKKKPPPTMFEEPDMSAFDFGF